MALFLLTDLINKVNRLAAGGLTIGDVTVAEPGEPASVYLTGTWPSQVLNMVLPYGPGDVVVEPPANSPIALDTDGQPYFSVDFGLGEGIALFLDTDGQPYFDVEQPYSAGDLEILFDTDNQPYFVSGA